MFAQLTLKMPQQALTLLEGVLITITCTGSLLDRARALFLWVRCHVAAADNMADKHKQLGQFLQTFVLAPGPVHTGLGSRFAPKSFDVAV